MSVKEKIKRFEENAQPESGPGNSPSPGKLDLTRLAKFLAPTPSKPPTRGDTPLHVQSDMEIFMTPFSEAPVEQMSLTLADTRESVAPTTSIELNHRLKFLSHPIPPVY